MSEIARNPLCWPNNVTRTAPQNRGCPQFDHRTISAGSIAVCHEINRLNKRRYDWEDESVIISSNLRIKADGTPSSTSPEPADTGIAVFFKLRFARNGKWHERPCVLTCDKWRTTGDNLWAIVKDIEAQRARERWGCTSVEQAFQGYLAIPEKCGALPWWTILGIPPNASQLGIKTAYKALAQKEHPDHGGSQSRWHEIQTAYDQAMGQAGGV